ncbi:MAG: helix-turn-helix domain-containing protein [Bdellovibrionota bacterium]
MKTGEKRWLTTKEAAEYLGTTPKAILNKVHLGELKVYKYGSRNRYLIIDLENLILDPEIRLAKRPPSSEIVQEVSHGN